MSGIWGMGKLNNFLIVKINGKNKNK